MSIKNNNKLKNPKKSENQKNPKKIQKIQQKKIQNQEILWMTVMGFKWLFPSDKSVLSQVLDV